MNRVIAIAAAGFLALALIGGSIATSFLHKLDSVQAQLADLSDDAAKSARRTSADSADAAAALRRAADTHVRDSLKLVAARSEIARRIAHTTADSAVAVAPDTCAPVIAALRADVAANAHTAEVNLQLWETEVDNHAGTQRALVRAQLGLAAAAQDLARLSAEAKKIEVPRPSLLSRILPQTSVGCTAGLSSFSARPDIVCGLSVGWEVRL